MTAILRVALASAWNRRSTLALTVLSVALSVALLLGVDLLRRAARTSFEQSVSGTDLIVGARTSPVQLLLHSVFRLGSGVPSIEWKSFQTIASHPAVAWAVPISLGDAHHGFPVVGTTAEYFQRYRYGDRQPLRISDGAPFAGVFEAVIGSDVAARLRYRLGDRIVLAHGDEAHSPEHGDKPFVVAGILARTGTPVDRSVHVSLAGLEAIHLEWQAGVPLPGLTIPAELVSKFDLAPKEVTAALVALENRAAALDFQRYVNDFKDEPLLAILPGIALAELWQMTGRIETVLFAISALVFAVGVLGLVAVVLASLGERRRELAILRSVGAGPAVVLALLMIEGVLVVLTGVIAGIVALFVAVTIGEPLVTSELGIVLPALQTSVGVVPLLIALIVVGSLASIVPGVRAYRLALSDGLTPRL